MVVWQRAGQKPLPESLTTYFTDEYMRHQPQLIKLVPSDVFLIWNISTPGYNNLFLNIVRQYIVLPVTIYERKGRQISFWKYTSLQIITFLHENKMEEQV